MRIHAGYEISYDCVQPMILMLSVHPSRTLDLVTVDRMQVDPLLPINTYHDNFGNFCHVLRAPACRLTLSADFVVEDSGQPDAIAPQALQHALEDLPVEVLIYLLGSRHCETDLLSGIAAPMDFSAWFEAYLGGRWYTFDARHNMPRIGRVLMARGRDATDVAISTSFGPCILAGFKVITEEVTLARSASAA